MDCTCPDRTRTDYEPGLCHRFHRSPPIVSGYELSGEVGRVVIIGYGILFLMWQVPYFFALYQPRRFRVSLIQANMMQAIGFIGETLLFRTIPLEHRVLRGSILRFIYFDGGGLVLLIIALLLVSNRAVEAKNT